MDVDADDDGWPADADCDDHPGGTEQCDPADHDCDGVPFPDGICAEAQDFSVLGKEISRFYSGESLILPDVTGDGVADLVSQQSRALDGVVVWQADEPLPVQTAGTFPDSTFATWYETSTNTISGPLVAGDVNGDGYEDLAFARNLSPAGGLRRGVLPPRRPGRGRVPGGRERQPDPRRGRSCGWVRGRACPTGVR